MSRETENANDPVYMKIMSPNCESNDDDSYPNMVQQNFPNQQVLKKNLASRAPQKSDDFKVTFAFTSNKSSIDGMQKMLLNQ